MLKHVRASAAVAALAAGGCAAVKSEKFSEQKCDIAQRVAHGSACRAFESKSQGGNTDDKAFPRSVQKGVTYFLPKQKLRISAVRTVKPLPPIDAVREAYRKALAARDAAAADATAKTAEHEAAKTDLATLQAQNAAAPLIAAAEQRAVQANLSERRALAVKEAAASELAKVELVLGVRIADPKATGVAETKVELKILDAEPDPEALYYATPRHGVTRDDTLKVVVGANGLLASSNVVADDRTDEIIVEAAGAVALFLRGGVSTASASLRMVPGYSCPRKRTEPLTFEIVVDPADLLPRADSTPGAPAPNKTLEACFGYRVEATLADHDEWALAKHARASYPGYAYRARIPWTINLLRYHVPDEDMSKAEFVIEKSIVALLPNGGPVAFIPIKAAPFVKTVNDVTFKDGSIASWDNTRPSEMLEAVRLPVRVAKQIISVPTELLQLKVDLSSKEKAMAEVQAAQIATETKLRLLQECLAKETGDGNDGGACIK